MGKLQVAGRCNAQRAFKGATAGMNAQGRPVYLGSCADDAAADLLRLQVGVTKKDAIHDAATG
jgi:hypothetical protein